MTQLKLSTLDFPTLHRHAIGFDRIFNELNRTFANSRSNDAYPPYNVIKRGDYSYEVELAVAGFEENELTVDLNGNELTVVGKQVQSGSESVEYLHRGISSREFTRKLALSDNMQVLGAKVRNGILSISLEQVIPEEQKPKRIPITFDK